MAHTMSAIPLLPCGSTDEIVDFYRMLGFEVVYRQSRPNSYVAMRFAEIQLHFFGMPDFDPEQSYGSCILTVPDTAAVFEQFAAGMRAAHGKLLVAGIPRITRPRKRKNTGSAAGFTVVDPGGNWIRVFRDAGPDNAVDEPSGLLARTLRNAIVLGESKGDHPQAVKILDAALAKDGDTAVTDRLEALVYRAELAVRMDDKTAARTALASAAALSLDDAERELVADALANAAELARATSD